MLKKTKMQIQLQQIQKRLIGCTSGVEAIGASEKLSKSLTDSFKAVEGGASPDEIARMAELLLGYRELMQAAVKKMREIHEID